MQKSLLYNKIVVYCTWHSHIEMSECDLSIGGPLERVSVHCVRQTSPEIRLWS